MILAICYLSAERNGLNQWLRGLFGANGNDIAAGAAAAVGPAAPTPVSAASDALQIGLGAADYQNKNNIATQQIKDINVSMPERHSLFGYLFDRENEARRIRMENERRGRTP